MALICLMSALTYCIHDLHVVLPSISGGSVSFGAINAEARVGRKENMDVNYLPQNLLLLREGQEFSHAVNLVHLAEPDFGDPCHNPSHGMPLASIHTFHIPARIHSFIQPRCSVLLFHPIARP